MEHTVSKLQEGRGDYKITTAFLPSSYNNNNNDFLTYWNYCLEGAHSHYQQHGYQKTHRDRCLSGATGLPLAPFLFSSATPIASFFLRKKYIAKMSPQPSWLTPPPRHFSKALRFWYVGHISEGHVQSVRNRKYYVVWYSKIIVYKGIHVNDHL